MSNQYSLYEAKARFSEILRRVRERGETFVVSYHGTPVAEIRPLPPAASEVERRLAELHARGVLEVRPPGSRTFPASEPAREGVLDRFLADRDR